MEIWNPGYTEYFYFLKKAPFTQWSYSVFKVDGIEYTYAEQFMMAEKARFFKDEETLALILKSTTPREQKALGRKVKGFNKEAWEAVARDCVYKGNHAKFLQNPDMFKVLMETRSKLLVEVNPVDPIWGIGLTGDEARAGIPWKGTNWLGEVLTKLRESFVHSFTLLLLNADEITEAMANAIFEAGCDDATLSSRGEFVYLGFDREAETFEKALASAMADVKKAGYTAGRYDAK